MRKFYQRNENDMLLNLGEESVREWRIVHICLGSLSIVDT
jgi:hypothetical protein